MGIALQQFVEFGLRNLGGNLEIGAVVGRIMGKAHPVVALMAFELMGDDTDDCLSLASLHPLV